MDFGPIAQFMLNLRPKSSMKVDLAVSQATGEPLPGAAPPPGQLTPDQRADWQRVGLGQMKLGEFKAKHGFIPAPTNERGLFSR